MTNPLRKPTAERSPPPSRQLCPDCEYNLRGLAFPCRCPECGFAFDATAVIFRRVRSEPAWVLLLLGTVLALGGGMWPIIFTYAGDLRAVDAATWLYLALGGLITLAFARPLLAAGGWRYAIIQQEGLLARRVSQKVAVPWRDVRGVWLLPTATVWLWLARPARLMRIRGVFETFDDARRFAGQVRVQARMARRTVT